MRDNDFAKDNENNPHQTFLLHEFGEFYVIFTYSSLSSSDNDGLCRDDILYVSNFTSLPHTNSASLSRVLMIKKNELFYPSPLSSAECSANEKYPCELLGTKNCQQKKFPPTLSVNLLITNVWGAIQGQRYNFSLFYFRPINIKDVW